MMHIMYYVRIIFIYIYVISMITCRHMCAHLQVCVCVTIYLHFYTSLHISSSAKRNTHLMSIPKPFPPSPPPQQKNECQKYASLKNIDDINHLGVYLYCHCFENQLTGHYLTLTPNKCTTKFSQKIHIQHSQTTKKSMASLMFHLPPWMTGESPFL